MENLRFNPDAELQHSNDIVYGEPMHFSNNVIVLPVGVSHNIKFYSTHEQELKSLISKGDFVVSEVDPEFKPDKDNISINTEAQPYSQYNRDDPSVIFYEKLIGDVWQQSKNLLYVDPETGRQEITNILAGWGGLTIGLGESAWMAKQLVTRKWKKETCFTC